MSRLKKSVGIKINIVSSLMLLLCTVAISIVFVVGFYNLLMGRYESECVTATNVLSAQLETLDESADVDIFLDGLKNQTGYEFTIFEKDTRINTTIMQSGKRAVGTKLSAGDAHDAIFKSKSSYVGKAVILDSSYICSYVPILGDTGAVTGILFAGVNMSEVVPEISLIVGIAVAIGLIVIVLSSLALIMLVRKSITKPLAQVSEIVESIHEGDFSLDVDSFVVSSDELGILCGHAIEILKILKGYIHEIDTVLTEVSKGNLVVQLEQDYHGEFKHIGNAMTTIVEELNAILSDVNISTEQVNAGADNLSGAAQALAQGSQEQSATIEEISAAVVTISKDIDETANEARTATEDAQLVARYASEGSSVVTDLVEAMNQINETSRCVQSIVKVISDVAFQTNILALNAAVEAARAGEAGRGFSVVADEVRSLATKTAEAASQTGELIEQSIKAVNKGQQEVESTRQEIEAIASKVVNVVEDMKVISTECGEQATAISEIRIGLEQSSQVVCSSAATSEETAATAQELSAQANVLHSLVKRFKLNSK